jgi:hypothetical protein
MFLNKNIKGLFYLLLKISLILKVEIIRKTATENPLEKIPIRKSFRSP